MHGARFWFYCYDDVYHLITMKNIFLKTPHGFLMLNCIRITDAPSNVFVMNNALCNGHMGLVNSAKRRGRRSAFDILLR